MSSIKSALPCVISAGPTPSSFRFPSRRALSVSSLRQAFPMPSFSGLSAFNPLHSAGAFGYSDCASYSDRPLISHSCSFFTSESSTYEHNFKIVDSGGRIYAMRHDRKVPKLNRPPDQRKALLRGRLTAQLLKYGRIKTTRARASAVGSYVDKMITMAKDGTLHKRRQALGFIYEKQIVHALFAEVERRYGERNGGYIRIIRTLPRQGDNAPMAYIELV